MKIRFLILIIFFCIIHTSSNKDVLLSGMNDDEKWLYQYTKDDIKVYKMDSESISIIKLTKKIESADNIFKTILDIDNYNQVISNKKIFTESIPTLANSDTLYGYQKVSNIIPFVKNRHIIFKMFKVNDNRLDWKLLNPDNILFKNYVDDNSKILSYGAGSW